MNHAYVRNPWLAQRTRTGREYDSPYEARAKAGQDIHGEANFVAGLLKKELPHPAYTVLDAGCGTGRISIELARRGLNIVGVDLDEVMLNRAQEKAPQLDWRLGDLATIQLGVMFDAILLAGNVMIYLTPQTEADVLENLTKHLKPNGLLIAGFELTPHSWTNFNLETYETLTQNVGLTKLYRWSTWAQDEYQPGATYAVSVHTPLIHQSTASPNV